MLSASLSKTFFSFLPKFQEICYPDKEHSVDELLIAYKGRSSMGMESLCSVWIQQDIVAISDEKNVQTLDCPIQLSCSCVILSWMMDTMYTWTISFLHQHCLNIWQSAVLDFVAHYWQTDVELWNKSRKQSWKKEMIQSLFKMTSLYFGWTTIPKWW